MDLLRRVRLAADRPSRRGLRVLLLWRGRARLGGGIPAHTVPRGDRATGGRADRGALARHAAGPGAGDRAGLPGRHDRGRSRLGRAGRPDRPGSWPSRDAPAPRDRDAAPRRPIRHPGSCQLPKAPRLGTGYRPRGQSLPGHLFLAGGRPLRLVGEVQQGLQIGVPVAARVGCLDRRTPPARLPRPAGPDQRAEQVVLVPGSRTIPSTPSGTASARVPARVATTGTPYSNASQAFSGWGRGTVGPRESSIPRTGQGSGPRARNPTQGDPAVQPELADQRPGPGFRLAPELPGDGRRSVPGRPGHGPEQQLVEPLVGPDDPEEEQPAGDGSRY